MPAIAQTRTQTRKRVDDVESSIRAHCDAGEHAQAAEVGITAFGPEILGFLVGTMHSEADGHEAFSVFCERVVRKLPTFEWRSSFRTWAYTIARRSAQRLHRSQRRRRETSLGAETEAIAARVRTRTQPHLRTDAKDQLATLRKRLPRADQQLLVLRVDREMDFLDIARVLHVGRDGEDSTTLRRESARLRKRFQIVKDRLRGWFEESGLLDPSGRAREAKQTPPRAAAKRGFNRATHRVPP